MKLFQFLAILGLIFNIIGCVILASTINKVIRAFNSSFTALELFNDTIINRGDITAFNGLDSHRNIAISNYSKLTKLGLIILLIGFVLQLISIFYS